MIMSERLCSPLHSRSRRHKCLPALFVLTQYTVTSELLFELYSVPSVAYCIDSVMSFYQNNTPAADGLVISFNTASTSVLPILSGKGILSHAKRIPWGAAHSADHLLKLIQLKYTNFPTRVTPPQAHWMLRTFCEFAPDYTALLRSLSSPTALRAADRIVQFPFAVQVQEEKSAEELDRIAERRREQGRKLQELAAKMRTEKLLQKESDLQYLLNLRDGKAEDTKREWTVAVYFFMRLDINSFETQYKLQTEGFDDDAALDDTIKKLGSDLKKARKKEAAADGGDEAVEEPSFPLVDVPDADVRSFFDCCNLITNQHPATARRRCAEGEEEAKTPQGGL